MKWIETIKIQAASGREKRLNDELAAILHDVKDMPDCEGLSKIGLGRHAVVSGCFALQLWWESDVPQAHGSKIALSFMQSLQRHGVLCHSAWINQEEKLL